MAANSEDVKRAAAMRHMRGPSNGQPAGVDRQRMDRDRTFTHKALHEALQHVWGPAPKVKA